MLWKPYKHWWHISSPSTPSGTTFTRRRPTEETRTPRMWRKLLSVVQSGCRKKKSDQFSKGLSELLKGVYPGPLINSLLLSTSKKSTFSMDYHKCRQETILGKFPYWIDESIIKTMISYVLHCFWILSFLQTSCVKYSSLSRGKKSNSLIWHTSGRGTDRSLVRTGMNRSWSTWPSNLASQSGKPFRGSRSFVRMRTTTMNLTLKVC